MVAFPDCVLKILLRDLQKNEIYEELEEGSLFPQLRGVDCSTFLSRRILSAQSKLCYHICSQMVKQWWT